MDQAGPTSERENRLNWEVRIRCLDCGAEFVVNNVSASLEVLEGSSGAPARMVVLGVPNFCPECRNIRLVPDLG